MATIEKKKENIPVLDAIPLKYELYLNKNYNNLRRCKSK